MYIHLGADFQVNIKDIIGIFDLDITSTNNKTGKFLENAEKSGILIEVDNELPKSFIVSSKYNDTTVYLSTLSSATLKRRIEIN